MRVEGLYSPVIAINIWLRRRANIGPTVSLSTTSGRSCHLRGATYLTNFASRSTTKRRSCFSRGQASTHKLTALNSRKSPSTSLTQSTESCSKQRRHQGLVHRAMTQLRAFLCAQARNRCSGSPKLHKHHNKRKLTSFSYISWTTLKSLTSVCTHQKRN